MGPAGISLYFGVAILILLQSPHIVVKIPEHASIIASGIEVLIEHRIGHALEKDPIVGEQVVAGIPDHHRSP